MGVNLTVYYPGGVPLKTSYYCYHCNSRMEQDSKDKSLYTCSECNQQFKDESPAQDDELIDYQKFPDKF